MVQMVNFDQLDLGSAESVYNNPTGSNSSGYLDVGSHEVTIQAVESFFQGNAIKVNAQDDNEKVISDTIYLKGYQTTQPSAKLMFLLSSITGDNVKGVELLNKLATSPQGIACLTGMKVGVELVRDDKGYDLQTVAGKVLIVDAGKGIYKEIIEKYFAGKVFNSFSDARTEIKKVNASLEDGETPLKRAFIKIARFFSVKDSVDANNEALQVAFEATTSARNVDGVDAVSEALEGLEG